MKMNSTLLLKAAAAVLMIGASASALAGWEEPFLQTIGATDSVRATQESMDAVHVALWAVKAASVISSTFLLLFTAKRLHADDYQGALWTFVGAMVAGASPYLAEAFFFA